MQPQELMLAVRIYRTSGNAYISLFGRVYKLCLQKALSSYIYIYIILRLTQPLPGGLSVYICTDSYLGRTVYNKTRLMIITREYHRNENSHRATAVIKVFFRYYCFFLLFFSPPAIYTYRPQTIQ